MRHLLSSLIALSLLTIPVLAQSSSEQTTPQATTEIPRRLNINVIVSDPNDLKVSSGDRLHSGQLIADRTAERTRLESQRAQIALNLEKIQSSTITQPLPPQDVPPIVDLPPVDYLEEEAAVAIAQLNHDAKAEEIDILTAIPELDLIILVKGVLVSTLTPHSKTTSAFSPTDSLQWLIWSTSELQNQEMCLQGSRRSPPSPFPTHTSQSHS